MNYSLKPINSRIRNSLFNQMLTFKNWSVKISSVLGYTSNIMITKNADLV